MKNTSILSFLVIILLLNSCNEPPKNFLLESPEERDERMEWWREARFGMFIHWGLYAIPAGEWNKTTNHAEWIRTTAQIPLEEYSQFKEQFNPEAFDPKKWVNLAKQAGMKYIVITTKHHDGFCLFDSDYTDFDIGSTPFNKDIMEDLADACRKEGIKICWYYSIMDWFHPDYIPRRGWETDRPLEEADFARYIQFMKNQLKELVENYGDIGVLWFDGEWEETWTNEYGRDLYNYVRNLQPNIIINNRVDVGRTGMSGISQIGEYAGDFGTPEQEIPSTGIPGIDWETCMTMNGHWGYNKNDNNWKSTEDLIYHLVDIASKGGNFLLNVGPTAEGEFPKESIERLKKMGQWMSVNGSSIYGTMASPFLTLPWGKCTQQKKQHDTRLFLHVFNWPEDNKLRVPGIYNQALKAFLLSDEKQNKLEVKRNEDALIISLPDKQPDIINSVVVLDVLGYPDVSYPPIIEAEHDIFIDVISVKIHSERDNVEIHYTTDGSMPNLQSPLVEGSLLIKETTTIVARCFRDGNPVSDFSRSLLQKVEAIPPKEVDQINPGLYCKYYEGEWDSLPQFDSLPAMKSLVVKEIDLSPRLKNNHYGFSFEGFIEITETGVYDFYSESDDGSSIQIDDIIVVDNDGLHGTQSKKGVIPLKKGLHKIKVNFFEKSGSDQLNIYMNGPGIKKKKVPANILFNKGKKDIPGQKE